MVVYSFVIFVIIQAPPGDFLTAYVATLASSGSSLWARRLPPCEHQYGLDDRPENDRAVLPVGAASAARQLHLSLKLPQRPDAKLISDPVWGERSALALFSFVLTWVLAIPAGIHPGTHPRSVGDHILTVINYIGVATPNFMLALILMWVAFAYFDVNVTGLFSPDYVNAPWSWGRVADLLEHIWLPALVLGITGTARLDRIHARQPIKQTEQTLLVRDGARQWDEGMAVGAALSGAARLQPAGQHDRLVSAAAVLGQPDRRYGDEPAQHRPAAVRALVNQDMYLAGGILLIYSFLTIVGTLISDVLLAMIDPRIRMENST